MELRKALRRALPAIAAAAVLLAPTVVPAGGDWNDSGIDWKAYDEGLETARKSGKPVCLVFYTEWCPHCTNYAQVFHDEKVMERSVPQEYVANLLVIVAIITACFMVGVLVRTRLGKWIYHTLESTLLKKAPGYSLIKETVFQFIGNKKSPFSSVALVKIYGNDTMVSAFVTDTHENGMCTVFVPTGPNPTSGNIFHLDSKYVFPVDIPVEDAMRSIISCGAGSAELINNMQKAED